MEKDKTLIFRRPRLILETEPEIRAASLSFQVLRWAIDEKRDQETKQLSNRVTFLDRMTSALFSANVLVRLKKTGGTSKECRQERDLVITGQRDLKLLRKGAGLLLQEESLTAEFVGQKEQHMLYGPRFMPALREIIEYTSSINIDDSPNESTKVAA